jgi:hypothetical protein
MKKTILVCFGAATLSMGGFFYLNNQPADPALVHSQREAGMIHPPQKVNAADGVPPSTPTI